MNMPTAVAQEKQAEIEEIDDPKQTIYIRIPVSLIAYLDASARGDHRTRSTQVGYLLDQDRKRRDEEEERARKAAA